MIEKDKSTDAQAPVERAADAEATQPTAEELAGWAGNKLDEMGGASVGKVEGLYVDDASGKPEWLLARMGRFGHYTLVPARDAVCANGRVWVPFGRDVIRRAPRVQAGESLTRDAEQALLDHFGIGTAAAGRGAELADRGPSAVTTRPA